MKSHLVQELEKRIKQLHLELAVKDILVCQLRDVTNEYREKEKLNDK